MSEGLPIAFAVYPILLSGIALIWLFSFRHRNWPNWVIHVSAFGSIIAFAFMTGPWAFTSYYLRYVLLGLFAVAAVSSYFRAKRSTRHLPVRDNSRITVPSILVFLLFAILDALAIASHYPSGETLDVTFPLSAGTYYILQGGTSAATNPFHALGGSKLAIDIVKLNSLGNRADGIAPLELSAYSIFGEKLYSPCQGIVFKVRDSLPDNSPGDPDTGHPEGNYIALKCADIDILMAHLKRGSIKVEPGEEVVVGQPLAEIGNSGNTLEPHLHVDATRNGREIGLSFDGRSLSINSVIIRKQEVHNNAINSDSEKRRAFVAPLFTAGYGER